jgi:peptidoglycan/LPS O-acetylase OafA/YrhL
MPVDMTAGRIDSIDAIRGYASLAVCVFHLSHGGRIFEDGWLRDLLSGSAIGVPIFFVISGFVIPYSLWSGGYSHANFWRFLLKRMVRLEPPYIVALLVAVALWLRFGFHAEQPLRLDAANALLHAGYLIDVAKWTGARVEWYVPVFWTLAQEFQFYIAAALAFPLLASRSRAVRLAAFAVFFAMQAAGSGPFLYSFADLFLLGIAIFQRKAALSDWREFLLTAGVATLSISLQHPSFLIYGPLISLLVLRLQIRSGLTRFSGDVSYSLYLYHDTFGLWLFGALITVGKLSPIPAFASATAGSVLLAKLMFELVERPALTASRAVRYSSPTARTMSSSAA